MDVFVESTSKSPDQVIGAFGFLPLCGLLFAVETFARLRWHDY